MAESFHCPPVTITTLLICSTPIQNLKKKFLKNEMKPFAATWMDLENIILSEIRQR